MIASDVIMCFFFLLDLVSVSSKLETVSSECVSLQGHCGSVYSTQFSPDSSILLSASEDTSGTKIKGLREQPWLLLPRTSHITSLGLVMVSS